MCRVEASVDAGVTPSRDGGGAGRDGSTGSDAGPGEGGEDGCGCRVSAGSTAPAWLMFAAVALLIRTLY